MTVSSIFDSLCDCVCWRTSHWKVVGGKQETATQHQSFIVSVSHFTLLYIFNIPSTVCLIVAHLMVHVVMCQCGPCGRSAVILLNTRWHHSTC